MLFAFVETSYSESDVKQVDVSSLVLGFGVPPYHALCTLAILQQGPPAWCMMNLVLTDILVSTCISYENSNSWVNLCYNMGWQLWWMEHGEWLLCTLLVECCCLGFIMYRVGIAMPRCCYRNLTNLPAATITVTWFKGSGTTDFVAASLAFTAVGIWDNLLALAAVCH